MDQLVNATRAAMMLSSGVELDKLARTFDRALDIAPFVAPSEWIRGNASAQLSLQLVKAWQQFVGEVRDVERKRAELAAKAATP